VRMYRPAPRTPGSRRRNSGCDTPAACWSCSPWAALGSGGCAPGVAVTMSAWVGSDGDLLNNRQPEAGRRLAARSALFDESTFRHLHHLGLGPGWQVWEVGAR
jgi:hypothetical protein